MAQLKALMAGVSERAGVSTTVRHNATFFYLALITNVSERTGIGTVVKPNVRR